MEKKAIIIFIFLFLKISGQLEYVKNKTYGFFAGITLNAGTHVLRFGIQAMAYTSFSSFEIKAEQRFYVNLMTWGPPVSSLESITSFGGNLGFGENKKMLLNSSRLVLIENTSFSHSVGYMYNIYRITNKTSQKTGTIFLNLNKITLVAENDIFAKKILDRFRTGSFGFIYRINENIQFFINNILWTGKYGKRQEISHPHFRLKCYMDTTAGEFISYSSGILSGGINIESPLHHRFSFSAGFDSEKIRDFVQNKLIHDMIFLPTSWLRKSANCHLPMIDDQGELFLFRENQKIRKSKPYLNLGLNETTFY